ncbi:hypothetical protein JKF63_01032 [Porcisia hertigi]|uniref:FAM13A-like domain-containing protein n=1 Tax=Porcisia hertigi TaxID=2761500 RepID=A0A836KZ86_9TRYP|nr:hypothetical protein JKF63_01032 [Porcisia hertigi]
MVSDPILQILSQVIDDVSFSQTHAVSEDFRVYPRSSIDSVNTLQQEQRKRVEQMYAARSPSPDFLGSQLLAEYRGEAASLQFGKEYGDPQFSTTISRMTPEESKRLKRSLKKRIHEWEAALRDATGQTDVYPEQKAPFRFIYELYRVVKVKLLGLDPFTRVQSATVELSVENSRDISQSISVQATGASSAPASAIGVAAPHRTRPSTSVVRDGSTASTKAPLSSTAATFGSEGRAVSSSTARPAPTSGTADWILRIERVQLGTEDVSTMSNDALLAEKRSVKQVLYRFETDFEKYRGVRPGRHDRHHFTAEYNRYSELKNEIQRRSLKT